jgi:sugar lactone lactonase YvrE
VENDRMLDRGMHRVVTVAGTGRPGYLDAPIATGCLLNRPYGVEVAPDGSLYIADFLNDCVGRLGTDGSIGTVAGRGEVAGLGGDGGSASNALLHSLMGVCCTPDGRIYIADYGNNRIRVITADGFIYTVAGSADAGYSGDGKGAVAARLNGPASVAHGADDALFIADMHNARVRKVSPDGEISTVAGTGERGNDGDGGAAALATFEQPSAVAIDADGVLYVADAGANRVRRIVDGVIGPYAGTGTRGSFGDGGSCELAELSAPTGLSIVADGGLYIAEFVGNRARRVDASGTIGTVAGTRG